MKNLSFHKDFILNGKQFDEYQKLIDYASTFSDSITNFLTNWFDNNDFVVVKTSGSTGKPKEIKLKKQYMINSAVATGKFFDLPQTTTALLCLSADYIAGKMMLVRALTLGWYLDVVDTGSNPLQQVEKKYDFSAMVPLQVFNSLLNLNKIKKLIIGGGVVSKELQAELQNVSTACFATYGMTETITHIAVKQLNNWALRGGTTRQSVKKNEVTSSKTPRNDVQRNAKLVSSFQHYTLLPNIKISKDERDCLVINAPKVSDELVITNDLVEILSETEFKWLGRYDAIINSGGIKLIPEQIEEKLSAVIYCRFFVAGIPDKVLGEKLILIVESDETDDSTLNNIKKLTSLSKFEIPKEIYFVSKFIETETKKIQRKKTLDLVF